MKQYRAIIFLPFLLFLAFVQVNNFSVQRTAGVNDITIGSNSFFSSNISYPHTEIENCHISGHAVSHHYPGAQKTPGYLADHTKIQVCASSVIALPAYPCIELFDNNNLSYNYPFHNFW